HWRHTFMTFFSIAPGMMISSPRSFARTPIEEYLGLPESYRAECCSKDDLFGWPPVFTSWQNLRAMHWLACRFSKLHCGVRRTSRLRIMEAKLDAVSGKA